MAMATIYGSMANPPITSTTPFLNKQASNWIPATISNGTGGMFTVASRNSRNGFQVRAVTGDPGSRNVSDVKFPTDYTELLMQAKEAAESAFKDGKQLLEIEFPRAGLQTSARFEFVTFCFFPEANEVSFARQSAFEGCSLKLDYLTKPSLFEDFGFTTKVKMADRVKPEDETFLVAYPYFNVNEMLVVEELYKEAVVGTNRKLIIFNGELDRIRSGYYPSFFYPKFAELSKTFLPKLDTVYYINNFKGVKGGTLFRCYPEPWKVLRKASSGSYVCLHQQEETWLNWLENTVPAELL
ncbi:protein LPA3-like isoform X1 [Miscanthus floridulus]|uniref:protein LPA3-like isoform X1 n=1 Tax=Miscanthus floridulus TaxID=154761 RepID=UPI003457D779